VGHNPHNFGDWVAKIQFFCLNPEFRSDIWIIVTIKLKLAKG